MPDEAVVGLVLQCLEYWESEMAAAENELSILWSHHSVRAYEASRVWQARLSMTSGFVHDLKEIKEMLDAG